MPDHPPPAVFDSVCTRAGWQLDGDGAIVKLAGGRRQRIAVAVFREGSEEVMRLSSAIGDATVMNEARLLAALRMNARMRYGAVAIVGDHVAMVDTMQLRSANPDVLQAKMLYLAGKADEFEKALFGHDLN